MAPSDIESQHQTGDLKYNKPPSNIDPESQRDSIGIPDVASRRYVCDCEHPIVDRGAQGRISGDISHGSGNKPSNVARGHKYIPLLANEIRVFDVLCKDEGNADESIHIKLRTISLVDPESYCALSYTWGITHQDGSHLTHTIYNDGKPIAITKNLHQALILIRDNLDTYYCRSGALTRVGETQFILGQRAFARLKDGTRAIKFRPSIWCDAICIDQGDHREQSSQVKVMGSIYASSAHNFVWLGNKYSKGEKTLAGTERMLRSPWFQRRWVVQEANSYPEATSILLLNGMQPLYKLWQLLVSFGIGSEASPLQPQSLYRRPKHDLLTNLQLYNNKGCSDPRDCVYAIHSFSLDGDCIEVDYSKDYLEVYTQVAKHYLLRGSVTRILCCAVLYADQKAARNWPSWVPDWACGIVPTHQTHPSGDEFVPHCHDGIFGCEEAAMDVNVNHIFRSQLMLRWTSQLMGASVTTGSAPAQVPDMPIEIHKCVSCSRETELHLTAWLATHCPLPSVPGDSEHDNCIACYLDDIGYSRELGLAEVGERTRTLATLSGSRVVFSLARAPAWSEDDPTRYRLMSFVDLEHRICWQQGRPFRMKQGNRHTYMGTFGIWQSIALLGESQTIVIE